MRKVIHKWFWLWDFEKEEEWLNDMARRGLALVGVGFGKFEFENCIPGEYEICIEFLDNMQKGAEGTRYIEFLEETGAEHIGTFNNWVYLRKKASEEKFNLFSDNSSYIKYLTKIISYIAIICSINLFVGFLNLFLFFYTKSSVNIIGVISILITVMGFMGLKRIMKKVIRLEKEQQIFE